MPYIVCPCLVVVSLFVGCAFGFVALLGRDRGPGSRLLLVSTLSVLYQSVREAGCTEVLEAPHKPLAERGAVSPFISFWHDHVSVAVTRQ